MTTSSLKQEQRNRRHGRIRAKVSGTATCPRLAVFRSNRYIYAQLIDDEVGTTLVSADSRKAKGDTTILRATEVGKEIAKVAKAKKIVKVVFDRGGFKYQGSVAALADGARKEGLIF